MESTKPTSPWLNIKTITQTKNSRRNMRVF